jgi:hypothetical protein
MWNNIGLQVEHLLVLRRKQNIEDTVYGVQAAPNRNNILINRLLLFHRQVKRPFTISICCVSGEAITSTTKSIAILITVKALPWRFQQLLSRAQLPTLL